MRCALLPTSTDPWRPAQRGAGAAFVIQALTLTHGLGATLSPRSTAL
jgi:hypothetical protein